MITAISGNLVIYLHIQEKDTRSANGCSALPEDYRELWVRSLQWLVNGNLDLAVFLFSRCAG